MSSDPVITIEGAGKVYALFSKPEDRLKQMIFGRHRTYYKEFWALRPTNLEIRAGETWGIIGRNGSGKSTMLQMICGNLTPTTGRITVRGKVAALLELGAGFNPEFTGRENVYVSGALAGYDRDQVDARMDAILSFADIGAFVDQPVKTYSSGMFARLAFAVAINVDPDILVIDEALAVGDEAFQRKCFARMEQIKSNGATILFVSHAAATVIQMCDWAVLLHRGEQIYTGRPKLTVAWYQKLVAAPAEAENAVLQNILAKIAGKESTIQGKPEDSEKTPDDSADLPSGGNSCTAARTSRESLQSELTKPKWDENLVSKSSIWFSENGARIGLIRVETLGGQRVNCLISTQQYRLCYEVRFQKTARRIKFYFDLRTVTGVSVGGGMYPPSHETVDEIDEGTAQEVTFQFDCWLLPGTYFANCGVTADGEILHRVVDALLFRVDPCGQSQAFGIVDFGIRGGINQAEEIK